MACVSLVTDMAFTVLSGGVISVDIVKTIQK